MDRQRINVWVDAALWKQAGLHALANDTTKQAVLDAALREYLEKRKENGQ